MVIECNTELNAEALAKIVAQRLPEVATTTRTVRQRKKGSVYLDASQNGQGKTLASAYSLRAKPMAPVSTPLKWTELKTDIDPSQFNMESVPKRIKRVGDLFGSVLSDKQDVRHLILALQR